MGRARKTQPDGFVLYSASMQALEIVPDEIAGQIIKAGCRYFAYGEVPDFDGDIALRLLWVHLKSDIDRAKENFEAVCKRNSEIAAHRNGARVVTTGNEALPSAPNRIEVEKNGMEVEKNRTEESKADKPPQRKRFVPPNIEEVKAYCTERGNTVDPERFVYYYTANGWTQGRGKPIKDWKACVRTWEKSEREKRKEDVNDELSKAI